MNLFRNLTTNSVFIFQIYYKCGSCSSQKFSMYTYRREQNFTHLLVKHYNDLLDKRSSERGKDEVTYFYVGNIFCIYLGTKYTDFQEKIFAYSMRTQNWHVALKYAFNKKSTIFSQFIWDLVKMTNS